MNRFVVLLIFMMFPAMLKSGKEVDSLKALLPDAGSREKAILMNQIAKTYENIDPKIIIKYANRSLMLSRKQGYDSIITLSYKNLGIGYYYLNQIDSSIHFFEAALKRYRDAKDTFGISACVNNLGILHSRLSNFRKGIDYYFQALSLKESQNDSAGIAKTYNNIGDLFFALDEPYKALNYFQKSLDLHKKIPGDSIFYPLSYMNIGIVYTYLGKEKVGVDDEIIRDKQLEFLKKAQNDSTLYYFEKAIFLFNKALNGFKELDNNVEYNKVLSLKAEIYLYMGNYDKAEKLFLKVYRIFKDMNHYSFYSRSAYYLGSYYLYIKDFEKANKFLTEAIQSYHTRYSNRVLSSYHGLSKALYKMGKYKAAADTLYEALNISDSLDYYNLQSKLNEIESKYEAEKKDRKIQLLEKDKEIMTNERYILIVSVLLLATIIFAIIFILRSKNKMNKILNQKNKELEEAIALLEDSKQKLNEANESKDKFFSIMAHDLKNPIAGFKQVTEILSDDIDDFDETERRNFIEEMKFSSKRLYNLLENLLTWSRSQRGTIQPYLSQNDLYKVTGMTLDHLYNQAKNKNIELKNNLPRDIFAVFDPNLTSTIIRNLVSNSIKFSKEESSIEINLHKDHVNDDIILEVRDFGIGMDEKTMKKLFRIDSASSIEGTKGESGTGLGLIICKEFVEKQNGKIWVESTPNEGTSFKFTIPKK